MSEISQDKKPNEVLVAIKRTATRTRETLNPYILPRIKRQIALEKCLKSINFAVQQEKRKVIPILGAAGYGKSTILGSIYDELIENCQDSSLCWISLLRCNDCIESIENFILELGEKISEKREPITDIAKYLTAQYGAGVLLIDTLDLVLEKRLVPIIRQLFLQLLEIGTTIVFTCRDQDFQDFFAPEHESFAGFNQYVERHYIREFNDSEVREATTAFVYSREDVRARENPEVFAEKIISLSADSKSIAEITHNPLLLALLCDLFAIEETIPEDLTVSQLYDKYWDFRVAISRKNRDEALRIGMTKKQLCLSIAQQMYQQSQEHLRDFVYESQLELLETQFLAYSELKSDGVLIEVSGERIIFFHQTFLEYAIARWFESTPEGEAEKNQLKIQIYSAQFDAATYYIWPIFRQLLTLVQFTEFSQIYQNLNKQEILPFRSLALASVSRIEVESASILLELSEIAIDKNYSFSEALLITANSAPPRHCIQVWNMLVKLLANAEDNLINRTIETTCEYLVRFQPPIYLYFNQILKAIENRIAKYQLNNNKQHHSYGQFLATYYETQKQKPTLVIEAEILSSLKQIYFQLGSNARATVIGLYLSGGISQTVQRDFFTTIIQQPQSKSFYEKENAIQLSHKILEEWFIDNCPFGKSWFEILEASVEFRWGEVISAAVGLQAKTELNLMRQILTETFTQTTSKKSKQFYRYSAIALDFAIRHGGGSLIANILPEISLETIPQSRLQNLSSIVRQLSGATGEINHPLECDARIPLTEWLISLVEKYPVDLISAIDGLAYNCPPVEKLLGQVLAQLLPNISQKQACQIILKLNTVPTQIEPFLNENYNLKESRIALVKLYQERALIGLTETIPQLLNLCLDCSIDVARHASWAILSLVEKKHFINYGDFLPILTESRVVGVRQNCLKAMLEQMNLQNSANLQIVLQIFDIFANETAPEVVQQMYILADCCIWKHPSGSHQVDVKVAEAVLKFTQKILTVADNQTELLDMVTKKAFICLNQMISVGGVEFIDTMGKTTRALLRQVNISKKVDKLLITGLIHKIYKFDPDFLETLVREDLLETFQQPPVANQCAIAVAIAIAQGKKSPLLDELLINENTPEAVKSRILRERGV